MINLKKYAPVFKFVAIFAGIYIVLSLCYYVYQSHEWSDAFYPDPATAEVAKQSRDILNSLGYEVFTHNTPDLPSVMLYQENKSIFRVIEGCNALSVMILFLAFVFAFAKTWRKTVLFSLFGIAVIYLANLFRLVVLAVIIMDYPQHTHTAHDLVFPSIIYGITILLWIYWIRTPKTT